MNQATATAETVNIARHLPLQAAARPYQRAVVITAGRSSDGRASYLQATFAQLDRLTDRYAHALQAAGVGRGDRVLILVRPGIDLPAVIYAVFKVGGSAVFIDPGMGLKHLVDGVARVEPKAFVGVSRAQMALSLFGRRALKTIDVRLTVGGGLGWGASSLERLAEAAPEAPFPLAPTLATDEAAVLFTSGSTGPAKGVVYQHGMFEQQVRHLREVYGIEPGEVDLPGLPIFALFSVALGATTVFPEIDPTRPASLDPALFVEIVEDHGVTYSFGSPAIWKPVTAHCLEHGITLPSLRRVLMAGAPVPPVLHERLGQILDPAADTHTPYGATEALPVSTISGSELKETFAATNAGGGTCVGRPLPGVDLRIIAIDDAVIETWDAVTEQEAGQRGEIVVSGPQVTHEYCAQPEATRKAKIREGDTIWHRMGDLGYFDDQGRLWFLGRKAHRVVEETPAGPLTHYPVACEAIFNTHEQVSRSALIPLDGKPAIVIEPTPSAFPRGAAARETLTTALRALAAAHPHTAGIETFLFHPSFPVDLRHNAKIRREDLAAWAASGGR